MARHRRHYRGLVRFPGLGRMSLSSSVKTQDVLVGGVLGLVGSIGLQMGASRLIASGAPIPAFLASGSPVVGGLTTGGLAYLLQKKRNPSRATAHAVGASLAGLAVWGFNQLSNLAAGAAAPAPVAGWGFSPRTLPRGMGAPLFNNPRLQAYGGPIFQNPNTNLARLGAMQGFGDDTEDGMFPAP